MKVGVFLSSRDPKNIKGFTEEVLELGLKIAEHDNSLVYGGSEAGAMGLLANTVKVFGGIVESHYLKHLKDFEPPFLQSDNISYYDDMESRKRALIDESDIFVILNGGLGTMEELFQMLTEMSIGLKPFKPILIYESKQNEILIELLKTMYSNDLLHNKKNINKYIEYGKNFDEFFNDCEKLLGDDKEWLSLELEI